MEPLGRSGIRVHTDAVLLYVLSLTACLHRRRVADAFVTGGLLIARNFDGVNFSRMHGIQQLQTRAIMDDRKLRSRGRSEHSLHGIRWTDGIS